MARTLSSSLFLASTFKRSPAASTPLGLAGGAIQLVHLTQEEFWDTRPTQSPLKNHQLAKANEWHLFGLAADGVVTGKWSGAFKIVEGPQEHHGDSTAFLVLKQNGSDITGTVGPSEGEQHNITKGKIEGDKITLLVQDEEHTIKFDLLLADDRIKGNVSISHEGQTGKAEIDVTRVK